MSVGFPSLSIALAPPSELVPRPLAFALPAVEHPTLQSFLLVPGEIARTSYSPTRVDRQVAVCVSPSTDRHRLLVASRFRLSLLPLHNVCFGESVTSIVATLPATVAEPSWVWAFL